MIELLWIVPTMLLLVALKAFFSGSEIAMVSADKIRLRHKASQGDRGSAALLRLEKAPERYLTTTLIGTNVCVVALTTLATILMIRLFGNSGELWAVLIFSPLFLIFTEVVPKSVFQQKADELAPRIARPLGAFMVLVYPLVFCFALFARLAARLAGGRAVGNVFMTREMVRSVLASDREAGEVSILTWERLRRSLRLSEITVADVMIPIAEVTAVSSRARTRDAVDLACSLGHFRLPVYEGETSQVVGVVALDVWQLMQPGFADRPLEELTQPAAFVVAGQPVLELLSMLRARADRMAVVVDEFGSAIGMITLEDIQEEVLGDFVGVGFNVPGYVHRTRRSIQEQGPGSYLIDGRVSIAELNDALAISLPTAEAHTIGGFMAAQLRHLPQAGESVEANGYRFSVLEATGKTVSSVRAEAV